jgi:hypothetical protein
MKIDKKAILERKDQSRGGGQSVSNLVAKIVLPKFDHKKNNSSIVFTQVEVANNEDDTFREFVQNNNN